MKIAMALAWRLALITVRAAAPSSPEGTITARYFFEIAGSAVGDLTNYAKFPERSGPCPV